ncbi:snoaL-like domain containing protein [Zalerion maritima]|uniref:SnoaL-like domain containing protein n=1 Tax=Zalerion maritima TaxID=339359 RepID=A0AAD5RLQ4_9PEZI|nr:snoaL-like domain containing protein [Zalerion maritima]
MSYVTKEAVWPANAVQQAVQDIIVRFYELADCQESDAGAQMAARVFSRNATLITPTGTFKGSSEISKSRDNAWRAVSSRKHRVLRVFAGDDSGSELVILGTVAMGLKNGSSLDSQFACHIAVVASDQDDAEPGSPRLGFMQVFALDSEPQIT